MYAVRHTEVHLPEPEQEEPDSPPVSEFDLGEVYDEGYYVAVIAMADEAEWWDAALIAVKKVIVGRNVLNHSKTR